MRSTSPRPPNSRGAHRPGLSSIDNDNWEEEDPGGAPASHRGRTFKHAHGGRACGGGAGGNDRPSHVSPTFGAGGGGQGGGGGGGRLPPNARGRHAAQLPLPGGSHGYDAHHRAYRGDGAASGSGGGAEEAQRYSRGNDEGRLSRSSSSGVLTSSGEESDDYVESSSFLGTDSCASEEREIADDDHPEEDYAEYDDEEEAHERTSLLPPPGISSFENHDGGRSGGGYTAVLPAGQGGGGASAYGSGSSPTRSGGSRRSHDRERSGRRGETRLSHHRDDHRGGGGRARDGGHRHRWDGKRRRSPKKSRNERDRHHGGRKRDRRDYHHHSHHHYSPHRGRHRHHDVNPASDSQYTDEYDDDSDEFTGSSSSCSSSSSSYDYRRWSKKKSRELEKERSRLIAQWKEEARAEAEAARAKEEANRPHNRFRRWASSRFASLGSKIGRFLAATETFLSNLPLTIGAVALAIVTLGVVWFKFAEENLDSCEPVHFHSSQCTFPEFPGCFYCDTENKFYRLAVYFHFTCSVVAGALAMSFVAKVLLARRVVVDEMSSPTTSSPAGLICMTTVCVFAGRGFIGQFLVSMAATIHMGLAIWFIYMALAYRIMPEPSWYPNTVGIGLSAVKTWLYYPMPGHFLMAISLTLNFFFFPISLIRVTLNQKISAPVGWIQMSAPSISLYALTIMAQPSFQEEHPDVTEFQRVHRMVYLPCMHFLFVLAVIGFISSVQSLYARWDNFSKKEFSPAHAAFCFPTLAHANAIQAYRGAVDAFSTIQPGTPFKIVLYTYWVFILVGGTIATVIITAKFFYKLPSWTMVDVADEEEPPGPNETMMKDVILAGETMRQPFVSPAVLQANETGALVMLRQDGRARYVRTRRVTALGFEPTMNLFELNDERDVLLDWVAKNPPRQRKRTLSVPGIDFNYGFGEFGTGNRGVYDVEAGGEGGRQHLRGFSVGPTRGRASTSDAAMHGRPMGGRARRGYY